MRSFASARKLLSKYVAPSMTPGVYSLERMQKLMQAFGLPQDKLKVIHIAGTSGKTSTSYFMAAMLKAAGQKVGLTVSPHVDEVNERVQIDLQPLGEDEFCAALEQFEREVTKSKITPTYFEYMVAFAYWYFAKAGVDYAVIEVGLGGLKDGTNVVDRADKLCIITDIGLDHTSVLGNTLPEIAYQKAGIIGQGNTVFMLEQPPEVAAVIKQAVSQKSGQLSIVPKLGSDNVGLAELPLFQRRNWWLALVSFDYLAKRDGLQPLNNIQLYNTLSTYIPARMELIRYKNKTVILDGAHNAQKMQALGESIKNKFPGQKIAVLLGVVESPDFKARVDLQPIVELSNRLVVTGFNSEQDYPKKSVDPKILAEHCLELGAKNVEVIADPKKAFDALLKKPEEILLVTGSFYLMNHIRPVLRLKR